MNFLQRFMSGKKKKRAVTPSAEQSAASAEQSADLIDTQSSQAEQADIPLKDTSTPKPQSRKKSSFFSPAKSKKKDPAPSFSPAEQASSPQPRKKKIVISLLSGLLIISGFVYFLLWDQIEGLFFSKPIKKPLNIDNNWNVDTNQGLPDVVQTDSKHEAIDANEIIQDFSVMKPVDFVPVSVPVKTTPAKTDTPADGSAKSTAAIPADTVKTGTGKSVLTAADTAKTTSSSTKQSDNVTISAAVPAVKKTGSTAKSQGTATSTDSVQTSVVKGDKAPVDTTQQNKIPSRLADAGSDGLMLTKDNAQFVLNNLLMEAEMEFKKGNKKAALEKYELVYKYMNKPDIEYNVILLNIETGNPERAYELLTASWLADTDLYELLQEMYNAGYKETAAQTIKDILAKDKNGVLYYFQGFINESEDNFSDASSNYRRAMIKSNYDPYIVFAYARIQDILMNYDEAVTHYRIVAGEETADPRLKSASTKRIDDLFKTKK